MADSPDRADPFRRLLADVKARPAPKVVFLLETRGPQPLAEVRRVTRDCLRAACEVEPLFPTAAAGNSFLARLPGL
jgi:hypothetical protein